jgi:flagellar biosynthesis chaperone FliJ
MELLEEKEKAAWLLEVKRAEQKELDEYGSRKR